MVILIGVVVNEKGWRHADYSSDDDDDGGEWRDDADSDTFQCYCHDINAMGSLRLLFIVCVILLLFVYTCVTFLVLP